MVIGSSRSMVAYHLGQLNHGGYVKPGPGGTRCTRTLTPAGLLAAQGLELLYTVGEGGELRFGA